MILLFITLQTLFAIYIFVRYTNGKNDFYFFKNGKLTKIGITTFCFHILNVIIFYKFQSKLIYYFLLLMPQVLLPLFLLQLRRARERRFRKDFQYYLSAVVISMKVGNSFRVAIKEGLYLLNLRSRQKVKAIIDSVVFSQHLDLDLESAFEHEICREFNKIDQMSHKSLYRISLWIQNLERQSEFRHKSGQILNQLYIQSGILLTMYIALFIFVVKNYGFKAHLNIIILSSSLFFIGIICSYLVGKRIKWKF